MSTKSNGGSWNEGDSDRPKWGPKTQLVAEYEYRHADGTYAFTICKGLNADGDKCFRTRRKNLMPFGDRIEPEDKVEYFLGMGNETPVLYRLPELIATAKTPGTVILVPEGEKDVESAIDLGYVATCNPFGAEKWSDEFSPYLTGANVIVIADSDDRGRKHAAQVVTSINGHAKSVRAIALPGVKDLTEWVEACAKTGRSKEVIKADLDAMIASIPKAEMILDLKGWLSRDLNPPDFICGDWLTTTSRTIVDADTGLGKTLWTMALTMSCAAGLPFMHWKATRPVRALYIDGEMPRRVMRERLADAVRRFGLGDKLPAGMFLLSHEDVLDGQWQPLNSPSGQSFVEWIITRIGGVDLIVFDNIMALISGDQKDEEGWTKTLPWIRSLTRRQIAQIWINHTGHDTSRGYGTKTREWQMDNTIHFDRVERSDTDVSFNLCFRKARERTPATRDQFVDVKVALVNDQWTWEPSSGIGQQKVVALHKKFYEALCVATSASGRQMNGHPVATIDEWRSRCVAMGLIDPQAKPDSARTLLSKARRELIAANWIACNETDAWTLGPNLEGGPI
jgi:hypothetical protein